MPEQVSQQREVVSQITKIHYESQRLEGIYQQKFTKLVALKQAILQKAFAGELTALPERTLQETVA